MGTPVKPITREIPLNRTEGDLPSGHDGGYHLDRTRGTSTPPLPNPSPKADRLSHGGYATCGHAGGLSSSRYVSSNKLLT